MASKPETRNYVSIHAALCKGCRVCIEACPKHCIVLGSKINQLGYQYARFEKDACTACGLCFYSCPEPGAITVYKDEPNEEAS
ncbi:MAG: 4Fe-4S dicluster domain-containing protein [Spirochaetales bacterium]